MADALDHPRIWLEPKCCADADYHIDRYWHHTRPDDCDEPGCGCPPTEYVRADLTPPASVVEAMERALREIVTKDDAGDMLYHAHGPFAKIAAKALADLKAWRAGK